MFRVWIKIFLLGLFTMSVDAEMKPFYVDSLTAIETKYKGQPFVLALWSTDCPPCFTELSTLAKLHRQQPELNIVLVSTDGVENKELALQIVGQKRLGSVDNWLFSDSFVESLRYSIDPTWHGELPRSYLYKANSNRFAHSGVLTERRLIQWIAQQKR